MVAPQVREMAPSRNSPLYERWKQKLSQVHIGKLLSEAHKLKISQSERGALNHFYNKHHTNESRKKIAESLKERYLNNPEYKKRNSEAHKGRFSGPRHPLYGTHRSEITKGKISVARKGRYTGFNSSFYGRHHTMEAKRRNSEAHKGNWKNSNNPRYIDGRSKDISWNIGYRGDNWEEIRKQVLTRDNHTCQYRILLLANGCKGKLCVHHFNNYRDTLVSDPNNMITLCRRHHSLAEIRMIIRGGDS